LGEPSIRRHRDAAKAGPVGMDDVDAEFLQMLPAAMVAVICPFRVAIGTEAIHLPSGDQEGRKKARALSDHLGARSRSIIRLKSRTCGGQVRAAIFCGSAFFSTEPNELVPGP
jgi:hypothetical protein